MTYIGKSSGFCQRHFNRVSSPYCPSVATHTDLHRSEVTLNSIRDDVRGFGGYSAPKIENELMKCVISDAYKAFRLPQLVKPIHLNDLPLISLENINSSPGLPWRDYGYSTKKEVLHSRTAFNSIRWFWHRVKDGHHPKPPDCAAYLRAHLAEPGVDKVRAVWGYPATVSFQEACFALPLINAYRFAKSPIAYGFETAKGGCRKIYNRFHTYKHFMSSDYKSFDKTIPPWLIRTAFDILCANIDFTAYEGSGIPLSLKLHRAWNYLCNYFINTPIRLCNGERYRKRKGVASGSYFTQLVDTIVNWIVTTYCLRKQKVRILDTIMLGDDSLVATETDICLAEFAETASECGMMINTAKTQTCLNINDVKFLGYYINHGAPLKPVGELYASLKYPERPDKCFSDFASRALGLCIANFGADIDFDTCCRSILQYPYKVCHTPAMIRYLKILGIDELPSQPPSLWRLFLMRY